MEEPGRDRESREGQARQRRGLRSNPLRRRIARRLAEGEEPSAAELAAELEAPTGVVAHHLELLRKKGALRAGSARDGSPLRYRWGPDEHWAREVLADDGEGEGEGSKP